jgi:hypothetical protein
MESSTGIVGECVFLNTGRSCFTQFLFVWFYSNMTWKFKILRNTCDNFQWNMIWHIRSMGALIFCSRLAESDVTFTPSVTCMEWLHWWHIHAAHLVSSSTALAFVTHMSKKHKSTSPSAIQIKKFVKDNPYWREIRHNTPTLKRWTNCWHSHNVRYAQ